MTNLTRTADILAEDWQRQQGDAITLADPALEALSAADLAELAARISADYERDAVAWRASAALRRRPFVVDWPALAKWRDAVLREPRRHPVDVVAAALEAMALECALAGHDELARKARAQAEFVVLGRRIVDAHQQGHPDYHEEAAHAL